MALLTRPQQVSDYHLEELDGELLLFHPGQTTIIACNPTASLIWQLCDGQRTTAEIVALLQTAFPEAAEMIPAEIDALLQQFNRHGALDFV
ncbi:MAG: PqqD family protein [Anaerolineae bacterium]|nr:PqqD family protein [Anaerolineae bacterium]